MHMKHIDPWEKKSNACGFDSGDLGEGLQSAWQARTRRCCAQSVPRSYQLASQQYRVAKPDQNHVVRVGRLVIASGGRWAPVGRLRKRERAGRMSDAGFYLGVIVHFHNGIPTCQS